MIGVWLQQRALRKILRGTDFTVKQVYVSLHDDDPGTTGRHELEGGGYERRPSHFDVRYQNEETLDFPGLPGGQISHAGLWDAETGGHFLWGGPFLVPRDIDPGDTMRVLPSDIAVSLE